MHYRRCGSFPGLYPLDTKKQPLSGRDNQNMFPDFATMSPGDGRITRGWKPLFYSDTDLCIVLKSIFLFASLVLVLIVGTFYLLP